MYQHYAGLIFDMDGTLFNSEPLHRQAWRQILSQYHLRFDEQEMCSLNGSPTWRIAQYVIESNQADYDPQQLAQEKNALLQTLPFDGLQLLPAAQILKDWHRRRPIAVGTGSDSATTRALLKHSGLQPYIDVVITADQVQQHKPAPDTFLLCAKRLGVPPERCVVFEDAEFGFIAAKRAGMSVIDARQL